MAQSRIENLLSGGSSDGNSEIEKILKGEDVKPNSRIGKLLKDYNPGGGGYPEPKGSIDISENGSHNVKDYASAKVNVPIPKGYIIPEGSLEITENGTYDVSEKASAVVNVSGKTPSTKIITINDNPLFDGKIHSGETKKRGGPNPALVDISKIIQNDTEYLELKNGYINYNSVPESYWTRFKECFPKFKGFIIDTLALYNYMSGAEGMYYVIISAGHAYSWNMFDIVIKDNQGKAASAYFTGSSLSYMTMGNIYVPDTLVQQYKDSSFWRNYPNNIHPLSSWEYYGIY